MISLPRRIKKYYPTESNYELRWRKRKGNDGKKTRETTKGKGETSTFVDKIGKEEKKWRTYSSKRISKGAARIAQSGPSPVLVSMGKDYGDEYEG